MIIIWGGILALVLSQLNIDNNKYNIEQIITTDQIKRIGVYYMCIKDLLM